MSYTQFHFIDKIWNFVAFTPFPSSFPNDFNRNVRKPLNFYLESVKRSEICIEKSNVRVL